MAHLQHMPGDPRLVDQLVYELKSKGIFDQFRKECIADVDTRPAYQNLRQRVETSVSTFLSRQCWQPDLNKNQLREKLRKHILDGNYLEQGVERIVDQVVNPKVASVFIPKVEDLVYNYLGIKRKKSFNAETSKEKIENDDLLPTDLEAVSPGSVKSEGRNEDMDTSDDKLETKMEVDEVKAKENTEGGKIELDSMSSDIVIIENNSIDKSTIPLPTEGIKLESIPHPENSPPMIESSHIELEKIELPKHLTEPVLSEIPLPDEARKGEKDNYFKPINTDDDDESSSDSSLRRNMSPLTPIRNFNNENSSDAQQAFNDSAETKVDIVDNKEPSSFRFTIESKSPEKITEVVKAETTDTKDTEKGLSYQFANQVNINTFNTPLYDDSSNSNNLQIDYESDANSKIANIDVKIESEQNSEDSKKDKKFDDKKPYLKSSHRSRDSHRHSSSKDRRSDSKHSNSRDSSRHDKKSSSKDESKSKSTSTNNKDSTSKDRTDKKDKESSSSSRHRTSHKSSSSNKDSKSSHKSSSSSSNRHPSKSDEKKSSSSSSRDKDKERSSEKDRNREKSSRDSKSSSHRSSKDDRKKSSSSSSSKRNDEKDKDKKVKKETDDHYSLSGRGNHSRRSTDRDSNDGSSSSKGSHNVASSKSSSSKKESKNSSSKSENTSTGSDTTPSDKDKIAQELNDASTSVKHQKSAVHVDTHLETPIAKQPRLPFVPDITIKKPKIASNMEEAKKMIKLRKFLEDEQKRMNQEAALLLEFQANVRPNLSQVYSSIPGPELEFACVMSTSEPKSVIVTNNLEKKPFINADNTGTEECDEKKEIAKGADTLSVEQQLENIYAATYGKEEGYSNNSTETSYESPNNRTTTIETSLNDTYYAEINVSIEENDSIEIIDEKDNTTDSEVLNKTDSEVLNKTELENILGDTEENETNNYEVSKNKYIENKVIKEISNLYPKEKLLKYFNENEKYNAEIERDRFCKFYKSLKRDSMISNKIYLINCDLYEENVIRDVSKSFGDFEVVNYLKNGHLKLQTASRSVIKNVNIAKEISLPVDTKTDIESPLFSPVKSECSFDMSSDYDTRLDEIVNQKSRQQIMEIILGNVEESPSKMPEINYCNESSIESNVDINLKRKLELDTTINNNTHVLTPNKMRKMSESEQITSTTEEMATDTAASKVLITTTARSKFLGKARRVGLPRPRKSNLQNSPSSDKSIENYEQNQSSPQPQTCKLTQPRTKIQRYDTSDLYKPKLHYLSRRNHVT